MVYPAGRSERVVRLRIWTLDRLKSRPTALCGTPTIARRRPLAMGGAQRSGVRGSAASEPPIARIVSEDPVTRRPKLLFISFGNRPTRTSSVLGDPFGIAQESAGRPSSRSPRTVRCDRSLPGVRPPQLGPRPLSRRSASTAPHQRSLTPRRLWGANLSRLWEAFSLAAPGVPPHRARPARSTRVRGGES